MRGEISMRTIFSKAIVGCAALILAACVHSAPDAPARASGAHSDKARAGRGSLSPSAPVNLIYRVDSSDAQSLHIDIAITTRLTSGILLVEVAKQEGAALIGEAVRRIDLTVAENPIALTMHATPLGEGEHFLVLLLTVETDMGPMSRSFRIDLSQ